MRNLREAKARPSLYVSTYAKYNEGSLKGKWMYLDDYADKEEFYDAIRKLHSDEEDPEFMFQDYEGFPERFYDESGVSEKLWDWINLDEEDQKILEAYIDMSGDKEADIDTAREKFQGTYSSKEDWAVDLLDDVGLSEEQAAYYLTISDMDIQLIAQDYAYAIAEDLRYDLKKERYEDVFDQTQVGKEEFEKLNAELDAADPAEPEYDEIKAKIEALAEKSIESSESDYQDELESRIKEDPIEYFTKELGYSLEDLKKQPFVQIDYEKFASDSELSGDVDFVKMDGEYYVFWAH